MAKIENTTVYPTVLPAASDLLIATDVSNDNKTVTFLVSDIVGGGGVAQDLQSVLDVGNTAIESINLTGNILVTGTVYPTTITAIGSTGGAGQILSSTGSGIQWINSPAISCCSWDSSLSVGNTATQDAFVQSAKLEINSAGGEFKVVSPATMSVSGLSSFTGLTIIAGNQLLFDSTGQINAGGLTGTAGQFLTSTGTSVAWSSTLPPGANQTLQQTIAAGDTSVSQSVTLSGTGIWTFGSNNDINSAGTNIWSGNNVFSATGVTATTAGISLTGSLWDGTTAGSVGQVLTSTGTGGVSWATASGGSQTLQEVLDLGNSATGANANITISGFIKPGLITDTSGSNGSAGQFLSSTGSGLAWVNTTCCSLDDTLTVGATSAQTITLTGSANIITPFVQPAQILDSTGIPGAIGQVLTVNGAGTGIQWVSPSGSAVTSVAAAAPGVSVGSPMTIAPNTGAVGVRLYQYNGGSNTGYVPAGGISTTYLDGSGNWSTPVNSGIVTSIGGSVGANITNTITGTAAVPIVNGALNATGTPNGTTFLRGDNTWAVPLGGSGNSFTEDRTLYATKLETNPTSLNTYCKFSGISTISPEGFITTAVGTASPTTWTDVQQSDAYWFGNGTTGGCSTSNDLSTLCGIGSIFISEVAAIYTFELWKANVCIGSTVVKAGELIVDYTVINTIECKEWVIGASPLNELTTNDFYFVTLKTNIPSATTVEMRMTNSIQRILS